MVVSFLMPSCGLGNTGPQDQVHEFRFIRVARRGRCLPASPIAEIWSQGTFTRALLLLGAARPHLPRLGVDAGNRRPLAVAAVSGNFEVMQGPNLLRKGHDVSIAGPGL